MIFSETGCLKRKKKMSNEGYWILHEMGEKYRRKFIFLTRGIHHLYCSELRSKFDAEKGLAMACMKKMFGNNGFYNDIFRKWLPEEEKENE